MQKYGNNFPRRPTGMVCFLLLAASVACSGCASLSKWKAAGYKVGPNYRGANASLEVEWIDAYDDPELSTEPPIMAWWQHLNDPTLNGLLESAYDQSLTLKQAGTRIQQAQAIQNIASGNLFPQVQQAVGDFQQVTISKNTANVRPHTTFGQFDLGAKAAWELDLWGRFRRSVEAADASLEASIASYDDIGVILLSTVAQTYIEIRTLQMRIALTQANIESQQGSLELAKVRYTAKKTNKLDVLQAQNNISVTRSAIPALEAQLRVANNRLCVLLGMPPRDLVAELPLSPLPVLSSHQLNVGIPADLLRRRPDIRRSERLMKAQSERIGIAETDLYPRIALVGTFEWQARDFAELFNSASVFTLVGPSFSWNILNYGRIRSSVDRERAKFCETVLGYQQAVIVAQREVEDGITNFRNAQLRTHELQNAVDDVEEAANIAATLYKTGATDFGRVFLLQSVEFSQQQQLVLSQANELLSFIRIYQALGGGWQVRQHRDQFHANEFAASGAENVIEWQPAPPPEEGAHPKLPDEAKTAPGEKNADSKDAPQQSTVPKRTQPESVIPESSDSIKDALKAIDDAVKEVEGNTKKD